MHKHRKSNINQREVGTDTGSFASGLRTVFRQSPDVIVVGEMRDKETFEIGLQAADTGHLVISSVHASNTTSIFDRVINMFEPHMQPLIRTKLADCLQLVLSQRLIPLKKGGGRILAMEKLINSYRIKKFIKDSSTNRIRTQMQAGTEEFESIDMAIAKLYNKGIIAFNDGLIYVEDEQYFRELTSVEK
jgi:twitching motility protein PilT